MIDTHSGDRKMLVTVAVCTWNRAALLDQTLAAMRKLRIPREIEWELLVVNNNCTDNTDEVISRHIDTLPLRRILEMEQGLSQARNRALQESQGELIAFIDDDVIVNPEWLAAFCDAAKRWPDAGFFAGTVFPWYEETPRPHVAAVLNQQADGAYLGINLGTNERPLEASESLRGANMLFRSKAARGLLFDPAYGRTCDQVWFGDEWDFCNQIRQRGYAGVWVPTASLKHFVPVGRLQDPYLRAYFHGLGTSMVRWGNVSDGPRILGVPRWILRAYCVTLFRKIMCRSRADQTAYFRALTEQWRYSGIIREFRRTNQPLRDSARSESHDIKDVHTPGSEGLTPSRAIPPQ